MNRRQIILIGNYSLDKQESMRRFALMLQDGFIKCGIEVKIWLPTVFFAKGQANTLSGIAKWLGYMDKWVLFPIILKYKISRYKLNTEDIKFHICDHSNALYLNYFPKNTSGITCHDVLAIRGALGFKDAYCPASSFGKILQSWILKNLVKAKHLASVSHLTLKQLLELSQESDNEKNWTVIHNAFNAPFKQMPKDQCLELLSGLGVDASQNYILHVGSSLERKNRKLLVKMVAYLKDTWNGKIYFAGKPLDEDLKACIANFKLEERIVSIVKPTHDQLVALYNSCEAFIFPSYSEGFGWPLIEAQMCGAPVIASNIEPMPEVSGNTAIHVHPDDVAGFANALLSLKDVAIRKSIITNGLQNVKRFHVDDMIKKYINLYNL